MKVEINIDCKTKDDVFILLASIIVQLEEKLRGKTIIDEIVQVSSITKHGDYDAMITPEI